MQDLKSNPSEESLDTDSSGLMRPFNRNQGTWRQYCAVMDRLAVQAMTDAGYQDLKTALLKEKERREHLSLTCMASLSQMYAYHDSQDDEDYYIERGITVSYAMNFDRMERKGVRITGEDVLKYITAKYGIPRRDLLSPLRSRYITYPRFEAMYLMRRYCGKSYPQIGKMMNRDHTTVLSGITRHLVMNKMPPLPETKIEKYKKISAELRQIGRASCRERV